MSNELARRVSDAAVRPLSVVSGRLPRPVARGLDEASYRGMMAAAKTQAAGYVTHVALSQVDQAG